MRSWLPLVVFVTLGALGRPAWAGRHVVERGETLEHVAQIYGCGVEVVMRANGLTTTLVPAGTVVVIPACTVRSRARTRERLAAPADDGRVPPSTVEDRARLALEAIDGATVVTNEPDAASESLGQPWNGRLRGGEALPRGPGYQIRRPQRAFGASHVVDHLKHVIAEVRALYPRVHTLAIGDLSAEHGGKLAEHHSHQSGLDVDIGFYFQKVPAGYPDQFVMASSEIDLEATWALITAFARTSSLHNGVQVILLDRDIQARLYRWAHARGTPDEQLADLLQYPRGNDAQVGIVRHWPHHANHLHVRFKPGP